MQHEMIAHMDAVTGIAIDPNGLYVVSASECLVCMCVVVLDHPSLLTFTYRLQSLTVTLAHHSLPLRPTHSTHPSPYPNPHPSPYPNLLPLTPYLTPTSYPSPLTSPNLPPLTLPQPLTPHPLPHPTSHPSPYPNLSPLTPYLTQPLTPHLTPTSHLTHPTPTPHTSPFPPGHDGSLRFWSMENYICVQEISAHRKRFDEAIFNVACHPSESMFSSAGADSIAKVFA